MIVLSRYYKGLLNAGPKAKTDIEKICQKNFNATIKTFAEFNNQSKIRTILNKFTSKIYPFLVLKRNEITLVQVPYSNFSFTIRKADKKIALIHDLNGLRYQDKKILKKELNCLSQYTYIIAHNDTMKKFLIDNGIDKENIYTLEMFDYLFSGKTSKKTFDKNNIEICYAGNLSKEKCPFIYQLREKKLNFKLNLYGVGLKKDINKKERYMGSFIPDILPSKLDGDIGLVWDGNYDESDKNKNFKNYTKYNNPHKLSCYLAAELPVIVWEKAAVAKFVKENNIGYTINNIYDINNLDFSSYEEKKKNVLKISKKLRNGYYTKKVLEEILKK